MDLFATQRHLARSLYDASCEVGPRNRAGPRPAGLRSTAKSAERNRQKERNRPFLLSMSNDAERPTNGARVYLASRDEMFFAR